MGIRTEYYTTYAVLSCSGDEDGKSLGSFDSYFPVV